MKAALAIAAREFEEHRTALAVVGSIALLALAAPLIPGVERGDVALARFILGCFGTLISMTFALIVGVGVIDGDLKARRMGFYFARPLEGWSIVVGKVAGGAALVAVALAIAWAPAFVLGMRPDESWRAGLRIGVALIPTLLGFGLVLALVLRPAKSRFWTLLDLAGAGTAACTLWWAGHALWFFLKGRDVTQDVAVEAVVWLAAGLAVIMLSAASFAIARGRLNAEHCRRTLTMSLWPLLTVGGLALGAGIRSRLAASPSDLDVDRGYIATDGSTLVVSGELASGRYASFVINSNTGEWTRIQGGPDDPGLSGTIAIADGRAAWIECRNVGIWGWLEGTDESDELSLATMTLAGPRSVHRVRLLAKSASVRVAPGGNLLAVLTHPNTPTEETEVIGFAPLAEGLTRRFQVRIPDFGSSVRFSDPQHLAFVHTDSDHLLVRTVDLNSGLRRQILVEGRTNEWAIARGTLASIACDQTLGPGSPLPDNCRLRAHSLADGTLLGEAAIPFTEGPLVFAGDRIVKIGVTPERAEVSSSTGVADVFDFRGREQWRIDLGPARYVRVGGGPEATRLLVLLLQDRPMSDRLVWFNPLEGQVRAVPSDLRPVDDGFPLADGVPQMLLFWQGTDCPRLVRLDPRTMARSPIIEPRCNLMRPDPL